MWMPFVAGVALLAVTAGTMSTHDALALSPRLRPSLSNVNVNRNACASYAHLKEALQSTKASYAVVGIEDRWHSLRNHSHVMGMVVMHTSGERTYALSAFSQDDKLLHHMIEWHLRTLGSIDGVAR